MGITVPERSTYSQILAFIRESGNEEKFAQAIFHTRDLESGIKAEDFLQGLSTLTLWELRALGQELSDHERLWRFKKNPKAVLVRDLIRNSNTAQINQGIRKLVKSGDIVFYQSGRWVIGPLGMTISVEDRDTAGVSTLDFLETYFDAHTARTFLDKFIHLAEHQLDGSTEGLYQNILTHCTNSKFIEYTNAMLKSLAFKISSFEDYEDFCSSPAGLFQREYSSDPLFTLSDILLSYLGEKDVKRDFQLGDGKVKETLVGKLLLENSDPRRVLSDLFGLGQLKRIASDQGLVAIDEIVDKQKLIEYLMFRIGFVIPKPPRGITQRIQTINAALRDLRKENSVTQKGIVTSVFADLESVIKDLICFYSTALWKREIDDVASTEEVEEVGAIETFLAKKFPSLGHNKPLHKLTLGQLKALLFALDNEPLKDTRTERLSGMLSRDTILTSDERKLLDMTTTLRPKFAHDVPQPVETDDCLGAIRLVREVFQSFLDSGTYPTPIAVMKEVTNEFGVNYYEGVDEFNSRCLLKGKDLWLSPGSYLMKNGNPPIAIDPVIVERFWSKS
jgi:hypothetical protein